MNGCSNEPAIVLGAITPQQIFTLVEILQVTAWRSSSFVAARYNERARNFEKTLAFLEGLGWIRRSNDDLETSPEALARLTHAQPGENSRVLAEALTDSPGPHREILARYLIRFSLDDGELIHRPIGEERLAESQVRNFLMELGAVAYQRGADQYVLNEGFASLYLWAKNVTGATDRAALAARNEDRHQLGLAAELVVVDYEQKRLGSQWAAHVRHIAKELPTSCYDIKSLTVQDKSVWPRFIEVKAVPADSFEVYWTAGEVEAARLLLGNFFLYLLPVVGPAVFDIDRVEIVQNPYVNVYQNRTAWWKNESVIVCRRQSDTRAT